MFTPVRLASAHCLESLRGVPKTRRELNSRVPSRGRGGGEGETGGTGDPTAFYPTPPAPPSPRCAPANCTESTFLESRKSGFSRSALSDTYFSGAAPGSSPTSPLSPPGCPRPAAATGICPALGLPSPHSPSPLAYRVWMYGRKVRLLKRAQPSCAVPARLAALGGRWSSWRVLSPASP